MSKARSATRDDVRGYSEEERSAYRFGASLFPVPADGSPEERAEDGVHSCLIAWCAGLASVAERRGDEREQSI
jgi:hypothetical protein